jgi:hypothetical protein
MSLFHVRPEVVATVVVAEIVVAVVIAVAVVVVLIAGNVTNLYGRYC